MIVKIAVPRDIKSTAIVKTIPKSSLSTSL